METKTTPLYDSTHEDIKKAKSILRNKYGIDMTIKDIIKCVTPGPEEIVKKVMKKILETSKKQKSKSATLLRNCI